MPNKIQRLDIRHIILGVLAGAGSSQLMACGGGFGCSSPDRVESFSISEMLSPEDVASLEETFDKTVDELDCESVCDHIVGGYEVTVAACDLGWIAPGEGSITCSGTVNWMAVCSGRRPLGHVEIDGMGGADLPEVLAHIAHLEAAAVVAFEELAVQLENLRAPADMVKRCLAAADDERLHAQLLGELAEHGGAHVPAPQSEFASDGLYDIALHNAVEGCVNETWAALIAHWCARHAADVGLRQVFARIAEDETRHGQLAWDLHGWLCSQLDDAQSNAVHEAQRRALAQLPEYARQQSDVPVELGQPTAKEATEMAFAFRRRLAA